MSVMYQYALGAEGQIVDVADLSRDTRDAYAPYSCCGCSAAVRPRFGRTTDMSPHFYHALAHDAETCSYESYLHRSAKLAFYETYLRALATGDGIYLTYPTVKKCTHFSELLKLECSEEVYGKQFLTDYFDKVSLEAGAQGFVADVLLSSERHDKLLLVEFAVTHECEPAKRNSGLRIVEWKIHSDAAIAEIRRGSVRGDNPDVRFLNFRFRPLYGDFCGGQCQRKIRIFLLYESGKCRLTEYSPRVLSEGKIMRGVAHHRILGWVDDEMDPGDIFRREVRRAHFDGLSIRNCYICKYHGRGTGPCK